MSGLRQKRYIGIMTSLVPGTIPFMNQSFYRQLILLGAKTGLHVFVFHPRSLDWEQQAVTGFTFNETENAWHKARFPLPELVYDRCFFTNRRQYQEYKEQIGHLSDGKRVRLLGHRLKGKWDVHQMLLAEPELSAYLPETLPYDGIRSLSGWFARHTEAILKPQKGSHGKGILHVRHNPQSGRYFVRGRDRLNHTVERVFERFPTFKRWLDSLISGRSYLIQRYLTLTTERGDAYDVRSLMQKDGTGRWRLTGMAVRCGQRGSITSNLHGGGEAAEIRAFLAGQFGEERSAAITAELEHLSHLLPETLERHHGRLAELGLDLGVDKDGRVWILEVNSKPGRSVFARLQQDKVRYRSLNNPIRYAAFLLNHYEEGFSARKAHYILTRPAFSERKAIGGQS
ncbi:YheC/YheD family protein [Paenibacillus thalictri]|uniref:YheC/YheD family protein n=1 Tax=Paenibacillus thalictri TaxID=2527873 RepID=A0A4Q9DMP1_9BACL|nr:YheC/YheD family protein [Paenibacillus thalictri]TBL75077.1 YheC/YheD family protein [Paenibacillus thalictri]